MMFAGWVNRQQLEVIEYLQEENRLLEERLGDRPIHFTSAERRRLARGAKRLGRKVLNELKTLVTLMRWYRELVCAKWDYRWAVRLAPPPIKMSWSLGSKGTYMVALANAVELSGYPLTIPSGVVQDALAS